MTSKKKSFLFLAASLALSVLLSTSAVLNTQVFAQQEEQKTSEVTTSTPTEQQQPPENTQAQPRPAEPEPTPETGGITGETGGDQDCGDPGVGTNFAIDPNNDPNGFDGDNDGIGCETNARGTVTESEPIAPEVITAIEDAATPDVVVEEVAEDAIVEQIAEDTGITSQVAEVFAEAVTDVITDEATPAEAAAEATEEVQAIANTTEITPEIVTTAAQNVNVTEVVETLSEVTAAPADAQTVEDSPAVQEAEAEVQPTEPAQAAEPTAAPSDPAVETEAVIGNAITIDAIANPTVFTAECLIQIEQAGISIVESVIPTQSPEAAVALDNASEALGDQVQEQLPAETTDAIQEETQQVAEDVQALPVEGQEAQPNTQGGEDANQASEEPAPVTPEEAAGEATIDDAIIDAAAENVTETIVQDSQQQAGTNEGGGTEQVPAGVDPDVLALLNRALGDINTAKGILFGG